MEGVGGTGSEGGVHLRLQMASMAADGIRGTRGSAEVKLSRLIASSFQCKLAPVLWADCCRLPQMPSTAAG